MTRIVHTTNTYLDRRNMSRRDRQDDYLAAFEDGIEYAIETDTDAILHTGNLFWSQSPDDRVVEETRRILERAVDADIECYLLYGERDLRADELLSDLESDGLVTRLTPRWNEIGDVAVFAHDATESDPESGYHYPPEDVTARVAVLYDDLWTVTSYDDVPSFESAVGWKLDGILIGNQDRPVRETIDGVRVLSPGPPERVVSKSMIDATVLENPRIFRYDISDSGIDIETHETDARPVRGFRLTLNEDTTAADVREMVADKDLTNAAVIAELEGRKHGESLTKKRIQDLIGDRAALARVYDERTVVEDSPPSSAPPDSDTSDDERPGSQTGTADSDDQTEPLASESESQSPEPPERPGVTTASSDQDDTARLVVFGHVGGSGDIVERIASETAGEDIDAYVYTGSNRPIPGGETGEKGARPTATDFQQLAEEAPVYVIPEDSVSVWTADTEEYAPESPPRDDITVPDGTTAIPFDGQVSLGDIALTRNPWVDGDSTVLVTHRARPERWSGAHAAYLAGGHFVGRQDRSYLNVGFASFDPGVGRDLLYGQYFDVVVGDGGFVDLTWQPLGVLEDLVCPEHEEYGRLYLLEGLDCPFCVMVEQRDDDTQQVETPTTVFERSYLVASDDLPARRAHQVGYFDRPEVTPPDQTTSTDFPPPVDGGQATLDERALTTGDLRGELMYFVSPAAVDEVWLSVRELVAQGELYDARVSTEFTRQARGDSRYLLLVAIPNYADVTDAHRVHERLTEVLERDEDAPLKPTLYTNLGIYASNAGEWNLSRSTRYTLRVDEDPTIGTSLAAAPRVEADVFPDDMVAHDQWLLWKPEPDGRKVPRAPWETGNDAFVSAMESENWTDYEIAADFCEKLPGGDYGLAFTLTEDDPYVLLDYDDARDPEDGTVHATVRQHIEDADSYADISTSGTGVHLLVRGDLSDDVAAIVADLPDHDFSLEVYDSDRYVIMTGDHLAKTPTVTREAQGLLDRLESEHATRRDYDETSRGDIQKSPDDIERLEETADIDDVFAAIRYVEPGDIRLRSTVTEERADGTKSLDPSWTTSESGTRLGQLDEVWIYRKGMHVLDALQVVALEEHLITSPPEYPSGETFWEAVTALRERGANIPRYKPRKS